MSADNFSNGSRFECDNHQGLSVGYLIDNSNVLEWISIVELKLHNYGIYINFKDKTTSIFIHKPKGASETILTVPNIINLTPDNFQNKIKTLLTFS
jgi:hypothetical protein